MEDIADITTSLEGICQLFNNYWRAATYDKENISQQKATTSCFQSFVVVFGASAKYLA